jgi:L-lysine exporter family protein LysE/ArgO
MMITPFLQGFGASAGLIVAIGAQNAFVLSQSVRGNHHVVTALICILCDTLFITAGIAGFGASVSANATLSQLVTYLGAGYLFIFGCGSLRSAIQGGHLNADNAAVRSLGAVVLTTLAVTLLNPHFYLDTVILLGSISSQFHGENRLLFWAGAVLASTLWFICLSLGGRRLAPVFKRQISWRILDTLICATMWVIALSLVVHGISDKQVV